MVVKLLNLWSFMTLNNLFCRQYVSLPPPRPRKNRIKNSEVELSIQRNFINIRVRDEVISK